MRLELHIIMSYGHVGPTYCFYNVIGHGLAVAKEELVPTRGPKIR